MKLTIDNMYRYTSGSVSTLAIYQGMRGDGYLFCPCDKNRKPNGVGKQKFFGRVV